MVKKVKAFLKKHFPGITLRLKLIKKVGIGLLLVNYILKLTRKNNNTFSIHYSSTITAPQNIKFNRDLTTLVSFAASGNCYFQGNNGIIMGKNCLIAPGVKIISSNHDVRDRSIVPEGPIIIGDNVWIGANAIVLPGVHIGNNVIIGAGSVITKSHPENNSIIAGNPAKLIRKIYD